MKRALHGLLAIFIVVVCLSIISIGASAEEDDVTLCDEPLGQPVVMYAGEETVQINIDFKNDWSRWEIWLDVAVFDWPEWTWDEDINSGDGWGIHMRPDSTVPPGDYPATCWINRTYPDNTTDRVFYNFTVSYIHPVEFSNFRMREAFQGIFIEIDVDVNVRLDTFYLSFYVWDDFITEPEDFEETNLEPGSYQYSCRVTKEYSNTALTLMGYYSYIHIGERTMVYEVEVEDPVVRPYEGVSLLTIVLGVLLLLAAVVVLYLVILRRRRRESAAEGDDRP